MNTITMPERSGTHRYPETTRAAARRRDGKAAELRRHAIVTAILVGSVILAVAARFVAFAPASLQQAIATWANH